MMAIFTLMNRKNRVVRSWDSVQPVIRFTRSFDGFVKEDELPIKNVETEGDATVPVRLVKYMTAFNFDFNIIEP